MKFAILVILKCAVQVTLTTPLSWRHHACLPLCLLVCLFPRCTHGMHKFPFRD